MIVAIGVDVDDTFQWFVRRAREFDVPVEVVNLRAAVQGEWWFEIPARAPARLEFGGTGYKLDPHDGFFLRPIDLSTHQPEAARSERWRAFGSALRAWLDTAPARVANRYERGAHNMSKPLHEAVLREMGFDVPESITSCDVVEIRDFLGIESLAISKTVCGVRADAAQVTAADFEGFEPEQGPVHLQRWIDGADARIHVVGDSVVAQRVRGAGAVDYRRDGGMDRMETFEPPAALRDILVAATAHLELDFAGWDFRIDTSGKYWCLEVNPMPGYQPYDSRCGSAISRLLFSYLGSHAGR